MSKSTISSLVIAVLAAALAACQTDTALPTARYVTTHRLGTTAPYKHQPTGYVFPDHIGKASRTDLFQYDEAGLDVSANYLIKDESGDLVLSAYIFPITRVVSKLTSAQRHHPALCRQLYEATKLEAAQGFADLLAIADERFSSPHAGWTRGGRFAITAQRVTAPTEFQMRPPLVSEFYLFCSEDTKWLLKYRLTYSQKMANTKLVEELIAGVPTK